MNNISYVILIIRYDLQVSVVEIIPPAVKTDLGGAGLHTFGENLDAFSDHVLAKMEESDDNTGYLWSFDIIHLYSCSYQLFFTSSTKEI